MGRVTLAMGHHWSFRPLPFRQNDVSDPKALISYFNQPLGLAPCQRLG
jgi:hypothetical protein